VESNLKNLHNNNNNNLKEMGLHSNIFHLIDDNYFGSRAVRFERDNCRSLWIK
jgi:hypothetical protein